MWRDKQSELVAVREERHVDDICKVAMGIEERGKGY